MSFSRAKRFNYKPPDVDCSPADYMLRLGFENGYSMPKCPRFQKCQSCSDGSMICSKSNHTYCTPNHTEHNCCTKHDKKGVNQNIQEFKRNETMRQSFKSRKKNDAPKPTLFNTDNRYENSAMDKTNLYKSQEFIDDDYGSMTSSEELDTLKDIEEYELKEVCKAIRRIKQKRLTTTATRQNESFSFQDAVLKKLETIDRNVKTIKEEVAYSSQGAFVEQIDYRYNSQIGDINVQGSKQLHPFKKSQQEIRSIIMRTIQSLGRKFENKRKSILKDNEEHILDILDEMYTTNDKSSEQIKKLCNMTAEELAANLNKVLQTSMCNRTSDAEVEHMLQEFINECYTSNKTLFRLDSEPLQDLISDYLVQTQEVSEELEDDLSDITLKCEDTHQMLHVQGVLLDEMKQEIDNLKSSMCEN